MTDRVVVEGVEVSTDHWIGGGRVPASGTFADVSPIDEIDDRPRLPAARRTTPTEP